MATRDNTSNNEVEIAFSASITTDTTTNSLGIDMSDFDGGIMYTATATGYTDGTYVITFEESVDNSAWTDVPVEKLIDPVGNGNITLAAAESAGDLMARMGLFSTKRYLRMKIISTSVTTGAFISAYVVKKAENVPV